MSMGNVTDALAALSRGEMIILVDDESRENEGDVCMLSEKVDAGAINFMVTHCRGLVCITMTEERLRHLALDPMVEDNSSRFQTAFTVSIEAREGVSTGISAADRAHTIRVASMPDCQPGDLARPGHVFPIAAKDGGVLVRVGQTEGSVDLARLCGAKVASGVICEIMNEDGTMARMPDLEIFAQRHGLLIVSIADIISYRLSRECLIEEIYRYPVVAGRFSGFELRIFRSLTDGSESAAFCYGDVSVGECPVRVHSVNYLEDVFGLSGRYDVAGQVADRIRSVGRGVILYVGLGDCKFSNEVCGLLTGGNSSLEDVNRPCSETRVYGVGAQCLRYLGVESMKLITNNPRKVVALEAFGLHINGHESLYDDYSREDSTEEF